jgi:tRNA uridine 5-carboxymethylaminomethyl modification enzyme
LAVDHGTTQALSVLSRLPSDVAEQLAIRAQYDGYIQRQLAEIRRHKATESLAIPAGLDYAALEGITVEAKDKLTLLRPQTLGQASRIAGVSPADISVLMVHLHRLRHAASVAPRASAGESAVAADVVEP